MHGFEWQDQRGVEGTGFVRALRSLLTANLPILLHDLEIQLDTALKDEIKAGTATDGKPVHLVYLRPVAGADRTLW